MFSESVAVEFWVVACRVVAMEEDVESGSRPQLLFIYMFERREIGVAGLFDIAASECRFRDPFTVCATMLET